MERQGQRKKSFRGTSENNGGEGGGVLKGQFQEGKKKRATQRRRGAALWPQVLCGSNEAILTRSL